MGASLSIGVMFSTNLTDDPQELESLKKELQNMQVTTNIVLHPTLEHLKNRSPKEDRNPDTGGYTLPTEHFIFISAMYELLISNPGVLDLIQFTAKQLIAKVLSGEGGINFGDIHVELNLSFLSNISTNIGREVVICNSTSSDKAIAILQGEVDRLKKEVEDLKKQNDESNHSVR